MRSRSQLDRLLVTLDVDVQSFALCQVQRGCRLIAPPVDAIMVHYVLSGTYYMTVEGYEPLHCSARSIVLIPPGLQARVALDDRPAEDKPAIEHSTLTREGVLQINAMEEGEADLRYVSGIVLASFSGSFGLFDNLKRPIAQNVGDCGIVQQAFGIMVSEVAEPKLGARALTSALMKTCLVLVIRKMLEDEGAEQSLVGPLTDARFAKTIGAVLDRPSHPHTLASMAGDAGMSRSSFSRHFTITFQMSPMEFVAKARLHHAALMLRTTPLPVKVIAGSVGFSSRSHFSRAFSAAYGVDPSGYRKAGREGPVDAPVPLPGSRERFGLAEEPRTR